jgi:streptogramin lyase
MNDSQKSFPLSIVPSSIALGSDGYIWGTTNDGIVTKVSPTGVESTFSVAASNIFFNNIVSGPDGALWFPECSSDGSSGGIGRIDTSGSYTFYSSVCQTVVANGPDGNIWFGDDGANIYSMTTGGILIGTYSVGDMFSFFGLTAGSDGALYAVSDAPPAGQSDLIRISTSGIVTHIGGDNYGDRLRAILSGPDGNIWIAVPRSESSFLVKFEVATQSFGERIKGPKGAGFDLITGPDGNIWASDSEESSVDTYVIQVMTATPNDLTVAVGKQANFHVIEANYGGQWTAISTKPSVASVTPNSTNGTFVVTGVAQGMTSVTVSDTKFNSIQVKVTVTSH